MQFESLFFFNEKKIILNYIDIILNLFLFPLSFHCYMTLKTKTNNDSNDSNITFLGAFQHKNWNHQIHYCSRSNGNSNKYSFPLPNMTFKVKNDVAVFTIL